MKLRGVFGASVEKVRCGYFLFSATRSYRFVDRNIAAPTLSTSMCEGVGDDAVMHVCLFFFSLPPNSFCDLRGPFTNLILGIMVSLDIWFNTGVCVSVQQQILHSRFHVQS